ncbi:hypothetical protein VTK73DRAFT_2770 [Phialemonium thermophilum]|uniref:Amino acid transporter n=1 Tax=Phialemonium thermophilum TaxID=223376 RepID=A0ABR3Y2E1_9PEZI
MTLLLWVLGSLISFCGLAVYLPLKLTLDGQDLGTAMPRSGGERVYLERIFNKPYMLATCMFMAYIVLLGFSTPNAIVLGEHALYALGIEENRWNVRAIAVAMVSSICYLHSKRPKLGLQLINILGVVKMLILVTVILSGVAGGLMGVGSDRQALRARRPDPSFPALLKVIYCFRGYSTANQVLSDVKNPVRTLKIAAPVALSLISVAYLTVNVAFFLVVEKDEFKSAGVVVAAVFFRNVFGPDIGAHVLPFFVIISAASNIAATSFAQARVNEELARDGLLPCGYCFKPSSIPSRGLLLHWLISVLAIVLPPPGRIYIFLINIGGYPVSVISVALSVEQILEERTG